MKMMTLLSDKKICFKCKTEKLLEHFYRHPKTKDGYLGKCKDCAKIDTKRDYKTNILNSEWVEKENKRNRDRHKNSNYKYLPNLESKKTSIIKHRNKYPEKYKAKIKSQRLSKICKSNQLHHWSYNEKHYKDCIELSIEEHALLHRFLIYDEKTFYYKDLKGNTLDTKSKHLGYWYKIKQDENNKKSKV